ncbi:MAG TPA: Gfo/Idh/MocA family oxidoreductase [bacterium]
MKRREFLAAAGTAVAGAVIAGPVLQKTLVKAGPKKKLALVGTGSRGTGMWGKDVLRDYGDRVEFVGLCDKNPGRVETGKKIIGAACPTFTDFDQMLDETSPDALIVTTVDATHDEFIVKGLARGLEVITEKPMTTDERKCQAIFDAERKAEKPIVVTFNYRYSPHRQKIKELLQKHRIGQVVSVDFNWYLDVYHGADYFRRWHGQRDKSGTLLVHKATHHFDLLNWWIDSDPFEVFAYGALEFYGSNHEFRSKKCRGCEFKSKCKFFWDITKDRDAARLTALYVNNEKHDGYLRDRCVWNEDVDIFDKMAVQIKYANNVQVSYSLTTYSPYEGYRIVFNGTDGRLEAWIHERQPWPMDKFDEIRVTDSFGKTELIRIPQGTGGHGGGDVRMKDRIFKNPGADDPLELAAGSRDGAMSCLVGIAARKSIDTGKPVRITSLTDLVPTPDRT